MSDATREYESARAAEKAAYDALLAGSGQPNFYELRQRWQEAADRTEAARQAMAEGTRADFTRTRP